MKTAILVATLLVSFAIPATAAPMFSAQERAQGLLEGRGMGLATPAEDHGYPGPRHVLDAADKLGLTNAQREKTSQLVAAMKVEAIPAAKKLLADEAALDQIFIDHTATIATITAASDLAARDESALRIIHLKFHLAMIDVLTAQQIAVYQRLSATETKSPAMPDMPGMSDHHGVNQAH